MGKNQVGGFNAKVALCLLVVVYIFNFIDRQILTILAEDIKADLGISDSDIGFLFGTAFGVFYSVVGIPMGKLADTWNRKNLISIGLAFWSLMTFLSGLAKSFFALSIYRFGVGIGESTASPAAYSLLSDYFSPKVRATVLAIYSSGLYIGAGIGLFLGGSILDTWNAWYPDITQAPFGLKGWQVAFMAVGFPGIVLAVVTYAFIKEPVRGLSEGIETKPSNSPFLDTFKEFLGLTPLSLIGTRNFLNKMLFNFIMGFLLFLSCFYLYKFTEDFLQWTAWGIGAYLVFSWIQTLKTRDIVAFEIMFKNKALVFSLISVPFLPFVSYGYTAFQPAFYIRNHGMEASEIGLLIGILTIVGSFLGVVGGGYLGDKLRVKYVNAKLYLIIAACFLTAITCLGFIYTSNTNLSLFWNFLYHLVSASYLGCAASTVTDLVLPRMRGMAAAFFILTLSMIGLALGPYTVGQLSDVFFAQGMASGDGLRLSMALVLVVLIIPVIFISIACFNLKQEEDNLLNKARSLGEDI
ncbi:MAG: MFS transporter [Proteobacteria bacterium]|nr:MFS transporter [Pseudomonadota bacterium]RZO98854.1 MAG: MFS transporter [Gammaproteobacteria bacterium]|tara:strand:- start:9384 stop:10952 length:1569 start_codon:yes stop_codon:yes gene_type:complete